MTREELHALIEIELEAMRKWEERDYELERAFIDLLDAKLANPEAVSRAMALLQENLRKSQTKGHA